MRVFDAVEALLERIHGSPADAIEIQDQPDGPQGASGSRITYYRVASSFGEDRIVTKDAPQLERRALRLLSDQGCAVPPMAIADVEVEGRALVAMPYLEERRGNEHGQSVADGLAAIHAANRTARPVWLPDAAEDLERRLWLHAWRTLWPRAAADPAFPDDLRPYLPRLESAHGRLLAALRELISEGDSLTLVNVDLIPDSIRIWRGAATFLDWEQAAYGPLYLDLPNQLPLEIAIRYHDALDRRGYAVPRMAFLERYHEVGHYMGVRWLGAALEDWLAGGERRANRLWWLYYTVHVAIHGR
jgi:hypothetical protein